MTDGGAVQAFKNYPLHVKLGGRPFVLRQITQDDGPLILEFAQQLPAHDMLFLRRDITKQEGVDRWLRDVQRGTIYSIICEQDAAMIGFATIHLTDLEWSRHVADLRVTAAERARGIGLGRLLTREAFNVALALGIEKVIARMTPDQAAARELFEELGFQNEALLKDEVRDRDGRSNDLLIMAVNVENFLATRDAYGVSV